MNIERVRRKSGDCHADRLRPSVHPGGVSPNRKISPVAWRHIHMGGHYTFHGTGKAVDLDVMVADLLLE